MEGVARNRGGLLHGVKKAVGFPSAKVKKRKPELGTGFKRMK